MLLAMLISDLERCPLMLADLVFCRDCECYLPDAAFYKVTQRDVETTTAGWPVKVPHRYCKPCTSIRNTEARRRRLGKVDRTCGCCGKGDLKLVETVEDPHGGTHGVCRGCKVQLAEAERIGPDYLVFIEQEIEVLQEHRLAYETFVVGWTSSNPFTRADIRKAFGPMAAALCPAPNHDLCSRILHRYESVLAFVENVIVNPNPPGGS